MTPPLTVTPASTPARRQALLRWIRAVTPTVPAPTGVTAAPAQGRG